MILLVGGYYWINYTGCDSLSSTAADASTAYFAGHERWSMNATGCNSGTNAYTPSGWKGLAHDRGTVFELG